MSRTVTLVISDLHLGGGPADPGDDHIYQGAQLIGFLGLAAREQAERVELVINGDFLEFAQVAPEAYRGASPRAWCSEAESLEKLEHIIDGHRDIFVALRDFQSSNRLVTLAPGNHDVDLYWPRVQVRLRETMGPSVRFEIGQELLSRHAGKLLIGHGHVYDPADAFKNWVAPFVDHPDGRRLEMCPGTLFMVKFVNWLEREYPFADNVKPIRQLARLLLSEGRGRWKPVAWAILRFIARHPLVTLESREAPPDVPTVIRQAFALDQAFQDQLLAIYRRAVDPDASADTVAAVIQSDERLGEFVDEMALRLSPPEWVTTFDRLGPETLSIARSRMVNEKDMLCRVAVDLLRTGAKVVVFGHTHQPDEYREAGGIYFNPGSWTRYVELDRLDRDLTIEDLRDESRFPYELNYVRVEETASGALEGAELRCYERQGPRW